MKIIRRESERGHFATLGEVVATALRLLSSQEDWLLRTAKTIAIALNSASSRAATVRPTLRNRHDKSFLGTDPAT